MSIRRLIVFLSVVFFAVVAFGATPTLISGVVLEAENDLPIKDVTITYGKRGDSSGIDIINYLFLRLGI